MIRIWNTPLFFIIISLCLLTPGQAEELEGKKYTGFYTDVGFGYRAINASTSSALTLNNTVIPSSISSSGASHTVAVLTGGYSFDIAQNFSLGIGANISPANGLTQQLQVQALNRTTTVNGIKSLYNYVIFITPGIQI
jgi:outer membrane immunogenic protein